jgi:hypothetical protein
MTLLLWRARKNIARYTRKRKPQAVVSGTATASIIIVMHGQINACPPCKSTYVRSSLSDQYVCQNQSSERGLPASLMTSLNF